MHPRPPSLSAHPSANAADTAATTGHFNSLVIDNLNSDMYVRPDPTGGPDPPGSSDFVIQYINASFDSAGTASTITDHPPIESPSEKNCVSSYSAPNSPTWPTNTNKVNTSEDHPTNNNATLSPDDEVLLSTVFPHHSLMVKHFQEYATTNGFMFVDLPKQYFTTTEYSNFLEKAINHWDRKQLNLLYKQERGICIALPNLMAVSRVIVVLMSHIIGILARQISFLTLKDQTFPIIISYCPNRQW